MVKRVLENLYDKIVFIIKIGGNGKISFEE